MQLTCADRISAGPDIVIRWNGRQIKGTIRYNRVFDAHLYKVGVELDSRADEVMRELIGQQSEELRDANVVLEQKATLARQYLDLLDLTTEAIAVAAPDGSICFWNKAAERLYGWTREEALGRSVPQLLGSDPQHDGEHQARQARKDGSPVGVTVRRISQRDAAGQTQAVLYFSMER
jgi:PAS domain S-box-containing protein